MLRQLTCEASDILLGLRWFSGSRQGSQGLEDLFRDERMAPLQALNVIDVNHYLEWSMREELHFAGVRGSRRHGAPCLQDLIMFRRIEAFTGGDVSLPLQTLFLRIVVKLRGSTRLPGWDNHHWRTPSLVYSA